MAGTKKKNGKKTEKITEKKMCHIQLTPGYFTFLSVSSLISLPFFLFGVCVFSFALVAIFPFVNFR